VLLFRRRLAFTEREPPVTILTRRYNDSMKRNIFKSTAAVLVGFISIAVLGFLTDSTLQWAGILPVPNEEKFNNKHAL
jgi:hypothetical protein